MDKAEILILSVMIVTVSLCANFASMVNKSGNYCYNLIPTGYL